MNECAYSLHRQKQRQSIHQERSYTLTNNFDNLSAESPKPNLNELVILAANDDDPEVLLSQIDVEPVVPLVVALRILALPLLLLLRFAPLLLFFLSLPPPLPLLLLLVQLLRCPPPPVMEPENGSSSFKKLIIDSISVVSHCAGK